MCADGSTLVFRRTTLVVLVRPVFPNPGLGVIVWDTVVTPATYPLCEKRDTRATHGGASEYMCELVLDVRSAIAIRRRLCSLRGSNEGRAPFSTL